MATASTLVEKATSTSSVSSFSARRFYDQQSALQLPNAKDHVFVLEYMTLEDRCYAIGLDRNGCTSKLLLEMKPFLPVWTYDKNMLSMFVHLPCLDLRRPITRQPRPYGITSSGAIDFLLKSNKNRDWHRYDLPTMSFDDTKRLFYFLNDSTHPYNTQRLKTAAIYNLELLLLLSVREKRTSYDDVHIYHVWMNAQLEVGTDMAKPEFDCVAFDIETVSHDHHRVPLGENLTDILFSASISVQTVSGSSCKSRQYTLVHLPIGEKLKRENCDDIVQHEKMVSAELQRAQQLIRNERTYKKMERVVECFASEEDLLARICEIFMSMPRPYLLLGYNSKCYDMIFLAKRLIFLNMPQMNDVYLRQGMLCIGLNMLHIDLMMVMAKFQNELPSFSLKYVAKTFLEFEQKVDLDARQLRYIYFHVRAHGLGESANFPQWDVDLSRMMLYNDVDSILVLELWEQLLYEEFLFSICKTFSLSLMRIGQSKVSEYLSNKIMKDGLKNQIIFTYGHNDQWATSDDALYEYNLQNLAITEGIGLGGGFNYRAAFGVYKDVASMDYLAYYPFLIAGFNVSHESISIHTVGFMKSALRHIDPTEFSRVNCFRFCTHRRKPSPNVKDSDLENNIDSQLYVNGQLDNCSVVTAAEINQLPDYERLVIILDKSQRHGILSIITQKQNDIRQLAKKIRKFIKSLSKGLKAYAKQRQRYITEIESSTTANLSIADDQILLTTTVASVQPTTTVNHNHVNATTNPAIITPLTVPVATENDIKLSRKLQETCDEAATVMSTDEDFEMVRLKINLINASDWHRIPMLELDAYVKRVKLECERINFIYRNLKIVNSSIYGLLGSDYGVLRGINVAATATCLGRKYIINTGRIGERFGQKLILVDTDSTFLAPTNTSLLDAATLVQQEVLKFNDHLQLGLKIYPNVFVIAKKTYFSNYEELFCRGINKNGPLLWAHTMNKMYSRYLIEECDITRSQLPEILKGIYADTYEALRKDKTVVLCSMSIKEAAAYRTQTPAKKLIDRISRENPGFVFGNKINYFFVLQNQPLAVFYGIDFELAATPIAKLNLYKFYSKIHMPIFKILSAALSARNRKRGICYTLSANEFTNENVAAFEAARLEHMQQSQDVATGLVLCPAIVG